MEDEDYRFKIDKRFDDDKPKKKFEDEENSKDFAKPVLKSFQRFDPNDPEHVAWMEANKSATISGKKPKKYDTEIFNNELDTFDKKVIEGQFYEVDKSFAKELQESLAAKSNGSTSKFSFLSLIGRKVEAPEAQPETSTVEPIFEVMHEKKTTVETDSKPKSTLFEKPYFFIDTNNKQFKDILASFSCQQKQTLIRKRWEVEREKVLKKYKNIHKSAVRKKEWDSRPQNQARTKRKHGFKSKKDRKKYKKDDTLLKI